MPSRPPNPWTGQSIYRDDPLPSFLPPSDSFETIGHSDTLARRQDTRQAHPRDQQAPRKEEEIMPMGQNRPVRNTYKPYSDNDDPYNRQSDDGDGHEQLYRRERDHDDPFGSAGDGPYLFPYGQPPHQGLYDPADPTIQAAVFNPYGLQNQELCAIPYQPMEPRLKKWAKSEIAPEDVVLPLLLITFQSGVVDAATIKDFRTYTTGQTGNSILMVLAVFGRRPANLLAAGLSMAGFCIFSIVFGQLGNIYGHKTRGWLAFTMSVQILLLVLNIVLVSPAMKGVLPEGGPFEWAVIFTSAAQGAGQMVMAINSGVSEINTVGLTGLYASLGSDPTLFKLLSQPHVIKRNRRLWFLVIFWGGCFFGGAIATFSDMWISLVFALECKVVAMAMILLSSAFEVPEGWGQKYKKLVSGAEEQEQEDEKDKIAD